jgi:uncharacterized protein (DUF488 family)
VELMTIGYEGLSLEQFFAELKAAGVEILVDVRQMPLSRKKGFSKNALREAACTNGIDYVHLVEFGCPKNIRNDYKASGDWNQYTKSFLSHLAGLDTAVIKLSQMALARRCCLVCYEADPNTCHRLFVANRVAELSVKPFIVQHLPPKL